MGPPNPQIIFRTGKKGRDCVEAVKVGGVGGAEKTRKLGGRRGERRRRS